MKNRFTWAILHRFTPSCQFLYIKIWIPHFILLHDCSWAYPTTGFGGWSQLPVDFTPLWRMIFQIISGFTKHFLTRG